MGGRSRTVVGQEMRGADKSAIQGFVQFELVNTETGNKQVFKYNTVTTLGKLMFLATGPNMQLMLPSQIDMGALHLKSNFVQKSPSQDTKLTIPNVDKGLTMYLVNADGTLTVDSKKIPIRTAKGDIDGNKLIGHANVKRTTSSPKEGVIDRVHPDFMLDPTASVQRWRFDNTQANGTFNKICIGAGVYNDVGNGFSIAKGLIPTDIQAFGGVNILTGMYIRPSVTGITSATEILLSTAEYAGNNKANAVYDFATGKLTMLAQDDPRALISLGDGNCPQAFYNNVLYYQRQDTLYAYDVVNKTETTISNCRDKLWVDGNMLYFAYSGDQIMAYNMDTKSWGTTISISSQTFTSKYFTNTSPSYVFNDTSLGKAVNGNFVLVPTHEGSTCKYAIEFTDINNIEASIVGFRPMAGSAVEYQIGTKAINLWKANGDDLQFVGIEGFSNATANRKDYGMRFSEQWFGDLISFVELSSPVTKTENDVLYVSYGYRLI